MRSVSAPGAVAALLGVLCMGSCTQQGSDSVDTATEVRSDEIVRPTSPVAGSSIPVQPTPSSAPSPGITPTTATPPTPVSSPLPASPTPPAITANPPAELPQDLCLTQKSGSWGGPQAGKSVASSAGIIVNEYVVTVGFSICELALEKRHLNGLLVTRSVLEKDLFSWVSGISRLSDDSFVISGMRMSAEPGFGSGHPIMVVVRIDSQARTIWKKEFIKLNHSSWADGVVTDSYDNSYIAGRFEGFAVLKISKDGKLIWTYRKSGATGNARAMHLDEEGNLIVTGHIDVNIDPQNGDSDVFVVKLTPEKKALWSHRVISPSLDYGGDFTTTTQGDIVVTGYSIPNSAEKQRKGLPLPGSYLVILNVDGTRKNIIELNAGKLADYQKITRNATGEIIVASTVFRYDPVPIGSVPYIVLNTMSQNIQQIVRIDSLETSDASIPNFMLSGSKGEVFLGASLTPVNERHPSGFLPTPNTLFNVYKLESCDPVNIPNQR